MSRLIDHGQIRRDLTGVEVGLASDVARCTACGEAIPVGAPITVYASRPVETPAFRVRRTYCGGCDRRRIRQPTLGIWEALVDGRVAPFEGRLVLFAVRLRELSPPTAGSG